MLTLLAQTSCIQLYDRAPRSSNPLREGPRQVIKEFIFFWRCLKVRDIALYLALSGGLGQLHDLTYVIIGKMFRLKIFIHHHSFSYLNKPSLLNRLFFAITAHDTHIVLSAGMGEMLSRVYHLNSLNNRILSNAAFYEGVPTSTQNVSRNLGEIRIGYLSNITFEKGFVDFFKVLSQLSESGIQFSAKIAGPVSAKASNVFNQLLNSHKSTTIYLGAVYGDAKEQFYREIDIFLFPSKYVNEAQPLVIYEALRSGAHVLSTNRGTIPEMLAGGAGSAFAEEHFVTSAVERIAHLSSDPMQRELARQSSFTQARLLNLGSHEQLISLVTEITGSQPQ